MNLRNISCLLVLAIAIASCEKSYERPDITLPGSGNGGGGTTAAPLLTKMVITSTGVTITYTYDYDANNYLVDAASNSVVSSQTVVYSWHFNRDNAGKLSSYVLKTNITGFPTNGITYTAHYPTGSSTYDYLKGEYTFNGMPAKDSVFFTFAGGKVTQVAGFGDYAGSGYYATYKTLYTYDAQNNVATEEEYEDDGSGAGMVKTQKDEYTYDDKINPLQLTQDAFILGAARYFSKGNFVKQVSTSYAVSPSVTSTAVYSFQYNSSNRPTAATATDPTGGSPAAQIAYTYK